MFVDYLDPKLKEKVYGLPEPKPVREVALVHAITYSRKAIVKALEVEILAHIPDSWKQPKERNIIPI
jgi:hypothetical protein